MKQGFDTRMVNSENPLLQRECSRLDARWQNADTTPEGITP
jgi:hypothetical protein